jgi:hypothetical protein
VGVPMLMHSTFKTNGLDKVRSCNPGLKAIIAIKRVELEATEKEIEKNLMLKYLLRR